uniref:Uncharacterized protein n=1 Tax=Anguilla anguilla TaxID=7936 RepID=A0A0E9TXX5_ANGAN
MMLSAGSEWWRLSCCSLYMLLYHQRASLKDCCCSLQFKKCFSF